MASQGVTSTSRLTQMQAKFQQKQLQEREQKRIEMSGEPSANASADMKNIGKGKVREMFDRRRVAGIDRSNPLKPISTSPHQTNKTRTPSVPGARQTVAPVKRENPSYPSVTRQTLNRQQAMPRSIRDTNGNAHNNARTPNYDDMDNLDNETFPKEFTSLSLGTADGYNNNRKSGEYSRVKSALTIKLNPVVQKKSPSPMPVTKPRQPPARATQPQLVRKPVTPASTAIKPQLKPQIKKMSTSNGETKSIPDGMGSCKYCGRNFILDRLPKHETVCQKMVTTSRKVFDTTKQRIQGTDSAAYIKKSRGGAVAKQEQSSAASIAPKSNWRKKHEEFIAAIRAAKQVQNHLARGGDLRDLPPPVPSENPDYIQCPHCKRRFNQTAAERHIPKCANMLHNKPKPGAGKKG